MCTPLSTATPASTPRHARSGDPRVLRCPSPPAIVADLAAENVAGRPCTEAIYSTIYTGAQCLRMRRGPARGIHLLRELQRQTGGGLLFADHSPE